MDLTRRAFLRLTAGNSLAMAMGGLDMGGIGRQFPSHWISQPQPPAGPVTPVETLTYPTTCRECPAGCGMHVRHVGGRSLKAEGNPEHPVNRGGLCARGQSALQGLYDPDRLEGPLAQNRTSPAAVTATPTSWETAMTAIGSHLQQNRGRVFVISRLETGLLAEIMRRFAENLGGELLLYEPFDYRPEREVNAAVAGTPLLPWYDLDRCRTIVSFAADFLESWLSNVQFAWMFGEMHGPGEKIGRFAYVGPRLSMTAANADDMLLVPPGAVYEVAMNLVKIMAEKGWTAPGGPDYLALTRDFRPETLPLADAGPRLEKLAERFAHAGGAALAGPMATRGARGEATRLAAAVFLLNQAAGNFGRTIDFGRVHALGNTVYQEELVRLAEDLTERDTVILHETNPAFVRPELGALLRRAGLVVSLTQLSDETAQLADWLLPVDNPLESWGEYSPWTGIRGLLQPTMARLYDSRAAGDIFLSLADFAGRPIARPGSGAIPYLDFATWLRANWREELPDGGSEAFLPDLLRQGFHHDARARREPSPLRPERLAPLLLQTSAGPLPPPHQPPETAELWVWPSIFFFDGRTANRGWLQENPQPVSTVAWGSWAEIHPRRAEALGLYPDDSLELTRGETTVRLPVRISEDIAPEAVGLALGQGHWAMGEVARGRGVNGFSLLGGGDGQLFGRVTLKRLKGLGPPITLTATREQHGRELLRWEKLAKLESGEAARSEISLPTPEGYDQKHDLYRGHRHAGHRWAMVIDLQRCIGCGACAVACYAENNLAVMGPGPVREGREMAWLKIIPYEHPDQKGRLGFLPLACQHCDQAPCEPVCPVFASVHNEEGLNAQIYNRCIGTRYCSQNCPYKVRRFNWLNPAWRPPLEWQLNPEVTVRSRGVMEKCTFCVQRIREAEYRARRENRKIADGEIQPACVQSCPTKVFTFGDLLDGGSAVARLFRQEKRGYQLLHELNTKPATLYLKKIEQG